MSLNIVNVIFVTMLPSSYENSLWILFFLTVSFRILGMIDLIKAVGIENATLTNYSFYVIK